MIRADIACRIEGILAQDRRTLSAVIRRLDPATGRIRAQLRTTDFLCALQKGILFLCVGELLEPCNSEELASGFDQQHCSAR